MERQWMLHSAVAIVLAAGIAGCRGQAVGGGQAVSATAMPGSASAQSTQQGGAPAGIGPGRDEVTPAFQGDGVIDPGGYPPLTVSNASRLVQVDSLPEPISWINAVRFTPDDRTVVFGLDGDHTLGLYLWSLDSGSVRPFAELPQSSFAISPDGGTLAWSGYRQVGLGRMQGFYDGGQNQPDVLPHEDRVNDVTFSPDGSLIASGSGYQVIDLPSVMVWDAPDLVRLARIELPHAAKVVAFSPDGAQVAAGTTAGEVLVVDVAAQAIILTLDAHNTAITGLAYTPDGARILSASGDKSIAVWDVASGGEVRRIAGAHDEFIEAMALSPDGSLLATVGRDGAARVWNVETGGSLAVLQPVPLEGQVAWLTGVAFSHAGSLLATSGADGMIYLWAVE